MRRDPTPSADDTPRVPVIHEIDASLDPSGREFTLNPALALSEGEGEILGAPRSR